MEPAQDDEVTSPVDTAPSSGTETTPSLEPQPGTTSSSPEPSASEPLPEVLPIAEHPSGPTTNDQLPENEANADVEFIPWEELLTEGGTSVLIAPLSITSVSPYESYLGESLLVSVASTNGNSLVVAVNTKERTVREHTPHFECGNCLIAADGPTSVIATPTEVYGSTDGGYRYFLIATNTTAFMENVRAVQGQVWVFDAGIWLNAPLLTDQTMKIMPWTRSVTSVWQDTGLQVTRSDVNRLRAVGEHEEGENPCPTSREYYEYGLAFHEGERALVACEGNMLAVTEDFPEQAFTLHELDAAVTWIGKGTLATETSYYATDEFQSARGRQGTLQAAEQVSGYAASQDKALRVTNLGVWVSQLSEP